MGLYAVNTVAVRCQSCREYFQVHPRFEWDTSKCPPCEARLEAEKLETPPPKPKRKRRTKQNETK